MTAPVHCKRNPELEPGAAAGAGFEEEIGIERARAPFQAGGSEAKQLQFFERIGAGEGESMAVVVDGDLEAAFGFLHGDGHARGAGVLLHVVQGLADHLQHFKRHFLRQAHGRVGADERDGNAGLLLERFGGAARVGDHIAAIHIHRPHAVQKCAQVANLVLRKRLQLPQIFHAGVEIAVEQLAQDFEPHLEADEALQRPVVEIGGDALGLFLAGLARDGLRALQGFAEVLDLGGLPALVDGAAPGECARNHNGPFQLVPVSERQHGAKHGGHGGDQRYFDHAKEGQRLRPTGRETAGRRTKSTNRRARR